MKDYNDYNDYVKRDDVFDAAYCSVTIDELIEEIDRLPSADVVPVVRCKDCRYFEDMRHYTGLGWCTEVGDTRSKDWYCADGERSKANDD